MPVPAAPLSRHAMAYVLAGGRGTRLFELTDKRVKPAVYFGCKTRIIDFALSNALNSGIRHIAVATQYKAHSLIRHLQAGWNFLRPERNESFDILPASQRISESMWYEGTADAVYQNIDIVESYGVEYIVVLAGDHIYKMDYEVMLRQHVGEGADVTVGCIEVPRAEASGFGVMAVDANDRIISFLEKPKDPPGCRTSPKWRWRAWASTCSPPASWSTSSGATPPKWARAAISARTSSPTWSTNGKAVAHRFTNSCVRSSGETEAYWRDVGTLDAYWAANIDLTHARPQLDLYDEDWPIWTNAEITPPAKVIHDDGQRAEVTDSLLSGGCIVTGASIQRSLLFTRTHVHPGASLEDAVVLPSVEVGRSARLKKVVIDRGVRIPEGLVVGENPAVDAQRFRRSAAGVCLITQPMLDRLE